MCSLTNKKDTGMDTNPNFSEQEFDKELRELLKSHKQEKVSSDFTEMVMNQLESEKVSVKYKAVISSRVLFLIALSIVTLVVWVILQSGGSSDSSWTLPSFSVSPFLEMLGHWQQTLVSFWQQQFLSSSVILSLLGLLLALSIHYIFLAVLKNRAIKKVDQLYCL